ncbi:MAG: Holliday junction branch migration protein RuvA [Candidatus Paceibacterota bacterium]
MIGYLKGKVLNIGGSWIILDVEGVGYKIHLEQDLRQRLKEGVGLSLWTHLAVRENALDLYGFESRESLVVFETLLSVSGIGPKSALAILDTASPSFLRKAVISGESAALTKIAGIGKKNAEKIILELRGKFELKDQEEAFEGSDTEVYEALVSLGYSAKEVREALSQLPNDGSDMEIRIKQALKILSS